MTGEADPAQFFAAHRDNIRRAAIGGGGAAVVDLIEAFPTFGERLTLYTLARQTLVIGDGVPGGLGAIGEIADAAIAECEALLVEATDQREVQDLLRALHMLNFNLAADLADCWPDDDAPRQRRHSERGLQAANYLLRDFFKGAVAPQALANDHWVRGMHLLSLGDIEGAVISWSAARELALRASERGGIAGPNDVATLQVLLISGYLGLGSYVFAGDDAAKLLHGAAFAAAVQSLEGRAQDAVERAEASYMVGQLEKVRAKYAPGLVSS